VSVIATIPSYRNCPDFSTG